jgi:hypothetical protein
LGSSGSGRLPVFLSGTILFWKIINFPTWPCQNATWQNERSCLRVHARSAMEPIWQKMVDASFKCLKIRKTIIFCKYISRNVQKSRENLDHMSQNP